MFCTFTTQFPFYKILKEPEERDRPPSPFLFLLLEFNRVVQTAFASIDHIISRECEKLGGPDEFKSNGPIYNKRSAISSLFFVTNFDFINKSNPNNSGGRISAPVVNFLVGALSLVEF